MRKTYFQVMALLLVLCMLLPMGMGCMKEQPVMQEEIVFQNNRPEPSEEPVKETPAPEEPAEPSVQEPAEVSMPDAEPSEAPVIEEDPTAGFPYYLYVEKGSFTLTIYQKGEDGTYSDVYKTYRIAHGGNKTPAGVFELMDQRDRWHEFPDGGFVQYATRYHARLYIHSPLYGKENNGNLWPKYYDGEEGIGKPSTGGCLRMVTEAARFIYENCPPGTKLEIVNGSPKGTTSEDVPSRKGKRVDPTDVDANHG